jgi:hypothetical protein
VSSALTEVAKHHNVARANIRRMNALSNVADLSSLFEGITKTLMNPIVMATHYDGVEDTCCPILFSSLLSSTLSFSTLSFSTVPCIAGAIPWCIDGATAFFIVQAIIQHFGGGNHFCPGGGNIG